MNASAAKSALKRLAFCSSAALPVVHGTSQTSTSITTKRAWLCCEDTTSASQRDHVAWVGDMPAVAAEVFRRESIPFQVVPLTELEPVAQPRKLVVTPRSFDLLTRGISSDAAACDAIAELIQQKRAFHEEFDENGQPEREIYIVGVSGPSCSGKSTVTELLIEHLQSPLFGVEADKYFETSRMQPCTGEFAHMLNYEHPDGMALDVFLDDLSRICTTLTCNERVPQSMRLSSSAWFALAPDIVKPSCRLSRLGSKPVILVVEGFLLFTSTELARLCSLRIFVDVDFETCLQRRWLRDGKRRPDRWEFSTSDIPNRPTPKFERWFREVVWSGFLQHRKEQLDRGDPLRIVNGNASKEDVARQCLEIIERNWPQDQLSQPPERN